MNRARVALWMFATVCVLSLVAALIPLLKGKSPNVVALGSAIVWLVIAIATARKSRAARKTPPGA